MGGLKPYKTERISRVIQEKGFVSDGRKGRDHDYYYLQTNDGVIHHDIFVKLSHGTEDPGFDILQKIKRKMKFSKTSDFCAYMDCHKSKDDYLQMLKSNGAI